MADREKHSGARCRSRSRSQEDAPCREGIAHWKERLGRRPTAAERLAQPASWTEDKWYRYREAFDTDAMARVLKKIREEETAQEKTDAYLEEKEERRAIWMQDKEDQRASEALIVSMFEVAKDGRINEWAVPFAEGCYISWDDLRRAPHPPELCIRWNKNLLRHEICKVIQNHCETQRDVTSEALIVSNCVVDKNKKKKIYAVPFAEGCYIGWDDLRSGPTLRMDRRDRRCAVHPPKVCIRWNEVLRQHEMFKVIAAPQDQPVDRKIWDEVKPVQPSRHQENRVSFCHMIGAYLFGGMPQSTDDWGTPPKATKATNDD